jgi:hypothetical protein
MGTLTLSRLPSADLERQPLTERALGHPREGGIWRDLAGSASIFFLILFLVESLEPD